ncbi:HEAT repeat domain-containing protein [Sphingobacterium rhinopitheci]|uniref:HEAT repeat domain-containing protein n=1 Tax=Sphingobacterium rhinopitheci TaxID=2781960 RepID=UPI001F52A823|nr:HEAT repeat domain-containing protein [Sphingobacterium rhinopitheci]MCI0921250.1 HEAT repeat domain-containing protein [Sphingobacterium rhinopitheci]
MYFDYYLYYLSYFGSVFSGYPLIIRLTVIMVAILAIVTLIGFISLILAAYKVNRRDKRIKVTTDFFEDKLFFIMKSKTNYELSEIKELLQYEVSRTKSWRGDILTDIVLNVKNTLDKEGSLNKINYKTCLEALRIMGFWEKRIKRSRLSRRREAMLVVGQIDNGVDIGTLHRSTFHKDKHLRKTARELYTGNDNYDPFKFMEDNFDESFTQLDKLRLHSTLIKRDKEVKLPNLLRWINNTKNIDYITFILREVAFFKQHEAIPTLLLMLDKQENVLIRAQIVKTIGNLGDLECIPYLINRFSIESTLVRDAIIVALGTLKDETSLNFLTETYKSTEESNIKMVIARAIKNHGEQGKRILNNLQQNAKNNQVEDTLLNHVISEREILPV